MISQAMQDALNDQTNFEMYSGYIYLSMAAYLEDQDLPGMANWMKVQAQEELVHTMNMFNHVIERDGRAVLKPVEGPKVEWDSPLAAFEEAYHHEQVVTGRINKLVDLSLKESDHASNAFLQWYVNEQVEEEATVKGIIQHLKLVGNQGQGLFMIDRELGQRVFSMPTGITL